VIRIFSGWFRRYFSDPQAVILVVLLVVGFSVVLTLGYTIAPVLAAIVIAYLLEGAVVVVLRWHVPRMPAVFLVFVAFLGLLLFIFFGLMPLLWQQVTTFVNELPSMLTLGQKALLRLPQVYPDFVTEEQILELIATIRAQLGEWGSGILSYSLSSIPDLISLVVYLILVPLLVFFFLKDRDLILGWITSRLPRDRALANQVWREMDSQIGNYVRGKILEIIIVGVTTYVVFLLLGLRYAMLLGLITGLSVVIPYIGAAVVTIPVVMAGFFQWGWGADFAWLVAAYLVIQALDGNVLVPLLFSEAVKLHPVAIIVAVLVFGGIWGFWGVFFAIPLATLVKAVLNAWPRTDEEPAAETA
jgi:putative permease